MNNISRIVEDQIKARLFKGRAIILFGPRRAGKTTLVKRLVEQYPEKSAKYFHCELLANKEVLETSDPEKIIKYWGEANLVVLDEAQNVEKIGETLKLLVDLHPEIQIVATGSSSFELANKTKESMVGRVEEFMLYPLSVSEIVGRNGYGEVGRQLPAWLQYGSYPEVWGENSEEARNRLDHLVSAYLYKDVLMYSGIKNSGLIKDLLQLLARQMGNEVSYNELAGKLGVDRLTVKKYIDVLEQSFIVFTLRSYSRNLRTEITKGVKIYFWDIGVRNSLIQAFSPMELRVDAGAVWENWWIVERLKYLKYSYNHKNSYFWRTTDQHEVDYIEEFDNKIEGFEMKWNENGKLGPLKDFNTAYPNTKVNIVDKKNYFEWLL
jgi:hypothetical protein